MPDLTDLVSRAELVWATPGWNAQVQSSNVARVGYDQERSVLYVTFLNGGEYAYLDVPEGVWQQFLAAPSLGQAVHDILKGANGRRGLKRGELTGGYQFVRLN